MNAGRLHKTWGGHRPAVRGSFNRTVTVTFDYGGGDLRTIVAPSRKAAFADASARWGWGWQGEPCVSTPETIFNDLTGYTKLTHGQDFHAGIHTAEKRDRFRRTGQPYG